MVLRGLKTIKLNTALIPARWRSYFNPPRQFSTHEESLRGRPGYEHLNDPLYILIEAELPANVIDMRLRQAQEILEELLKPVVSLSVSFLLVFKYYRSIVHFS